MVDSRPTFRGQFGHVFHAPGRDMNGFVLSRAQIKEELEHLAARFEFTWDLDFSDTRPKVAILATTAPYCLYDLLLTHQLGELRGISWG